MSYNFSSSLKVHKFLLNGCLNVICHRLRNLFFTVLESTLLSSLLSQKSSPSSSSVAAAAAKAEIPTVQQLLAFCIKVEEKHMADFAKNSKFSQ